MKTEAQLRANKKYEKEHTVSVSLRLNKNTDADIIEHLKTVESKMGYIKNLIRKDMKDSQ